MLIQGHFSQMDSTASGLRAAASELQAEMGRLKSQAQAWIAANPDAVGGANDTVSQQINMLNQKLEELKHMTGQGVNTATQELTTALSSASARMNSVM